MVGGVAVFGTDNAMDTTMTSAGKSKSDDDEDEVEVLRLAVVGVLRLEMHAANGSIDAELRMMMEEFGGFVIPGF